MTRRKHLRRVARLCCHFLRNLAFYRSGLRFNKQPFWTDVSNNFLDISILEWCKLFGDVRGQHNWRKVITNQTAFLSELLRVVGQTEEGFDSYILEMRAYRDKFIAHLDNEDVMHIPRLRVARKSISFLYDYLLDHEEADDCFFDAPSDAYSHYKLYRLLGRKIYSK